jgi:hypothetical protein
MKNRFILLLSLFILTSFFLSKFYAQNFRGHASGEIGFINFKLRAQYEMPVRENYSVGINCNIYFINFVGPSFEPFFRAYLRKHGNEKGFFGQGKFIYGNLSQAFADDRFNMFGFGLGGGYKFLIKDHFTIEPILGYRFVSPPPEPQSVNVGETIGFYITTGFPLDFQLKFGYQF